MIYGFKWCFVSTNTLTGERNGILCHSRSRPFNHNSHVWNQHSRLSTCVAVKMISLLLHLLFLRQQFQYQHRIAMALSDKARQTHTHVWRSQNKLRYVPSMKRMNAAAYRGTRREWSKGIYLALKAVDWKLIWSNTYRFPIPYEYLIHVHMNTGSDWRTKIFN